MRGRKNGARTGAKVPLCEKRACRWEFDKATTAAQTASFSVRQQLGAGSACPFAAASSGEPTFLLETQAQAATIAAQRRQFELRQHQKHKRSGQAVTTTAQTAPPKRGSNWVQAQPARRKPRPSRRSAAAPNLAHTRNAPQRSSADHRRADRAAQTRQQLRACSACQAQAATTAAQRRLHELRPHQKRTPAVKRRPPARRPRRLNAAAAACRLSLPFRLFPWRGGALTAYGRPALPPHHGNSLGS